MIKLPRKGEEYMEKTIRQQIDAIIQNIREHPVHMTNMIHRMQRLREKIQAGELAPPAQFGFDERAFFDENFHNVTFCYSILSLYILYIFNLLSFLRSLSIFTKFY